MPSLQIDTENNGFTFYWKIKNFSMFPFLKETSLVSPVFRIEEMGNTEWSLMLERVRDLDNIAEIYLCREKIDEGPREISVYLNLILMKAKGEKLSEEYENLCYGEIRKLYKPFKLKRTIFEEEKLYLPDDILTVGCFVKKLSDNFSVPAECTACTDISTEKFSIVSPVSFPLGVLQPFQTITISKSSVSKKYPNFKIILNPNGSHLHVASMQIIVEMAKSSIDFTASCKLSVKNTKNTVFLFAGNKKYYADTEDKEWNLANSVIPKEYRNSKVSHFILHCMIAVSDGTYASHIDNVAYTSSLSKIQKQNLTNYSISEKLKCLYNDRKFCDFTFRVDGKDFPVHRAVIAAVSPVLSAMFDREMMEKTSSFSIIEDIDADTVQRLIDFAYSEKLEDLQWDTAMDLYSAADKYQFSELKNYCANYVISNLTIENVANVLTIFDLYQDDDCLEAAIDFVFSQAKEVIRAESWKVFVESKVTLANRIMQEICIKLSENIL